MYVCVVSLCVRALWLHAYVMTHVCLLPGALCVCVCVWDVCVSFACVCAWMGECILVCIACVCVCVCVCVWESMTGCVWFWLVKMFKKCILFKFVYSTLIMC